MNRSVSFSRFAATYIRRDARLRLQALEGVIWLAVTTLGIVWWVTDKQIARWSILPVAALAVWVGLRRRRIPALTDEEQQAVFDEIDAIEAARARPH